MTFTLIRHLAVGTLISYWVVSVANLGPENCYPDGRVSWFSSISPATVIVPNHRSQPLPSGSFPVRDLHSRLNVRRWVTKVVKMSLNKRRIIQSIKFNDRCI